VLYQFSVLTGDNKRRRFSYAKKSNVHLPLGLFVLPFPSIQETKECKNKADTATIYYLISFFFHNELNFQHQIPSLLVELIVKMSFKNFHLMCILNLCTQSRI